MRTWNWSINTTAFLWLAASTLTQSQPRPFLGREPAHTMHWMGAGWLMRATREDEENGQLLRRWLAIQPAQSVCDLGCGNGYHTIPIARAVGDKGTVYAVDIQPEMLEMLASRTEKEGLANVRFVEATEDDPKLPADSCDLVLLVDVYHELSDPIAVMQRVRIALRKDGRCVLVEFRADDPRVPIKPEHTMHKAQMVREMAEHGFARAADYDELPWQHAMAFTAAARTADGAATLDPRHAAREYAGAFVTAASAEEADDLRAFLGRGVEEDGIPRVSANAPVELRAGEGDSLVASIDGTSDAAFDVSLRRDAQGRLFVTACAPHIATTRPHGSKRAFYAMHTGTAGGPTDAQATLVKELGYDGLAYSIEDLAAARDSCERSGLDAISGYAVLDLATTRGDATAFDNALAPIRAAMRALQGGPGQLWLALQHSKVALRATDGDVDAERALRTLLDEAEATGIEIALYPHFDYWLETHDDALRLCQRLAHRRLGMCFNLCHFLYTSDATDPSPVLRSCKERLFAITLNGADKSGTRLDQLIQPLGNGDIDLRALLATLDEIAFDGPIALQGFGLQGSARDNLLASMAAWRALHTK